MLGHVPPSRNDAQNAALERGATVLTLDDSLGTMLVDHSVEAAGDDGGTSPIRLPPLLEGDPPPRGPDLRRGGSRAAGSSTLSAAELIA